MAVTSETFEYNNVKYNCLLHHGEGYKREFYGVSFEYDGRNINCFMSDRDHFYETIATYNCRIIDVLGFDVQEEYYNLLEDKFRIEKLYIVVENEVYAPTVIDFKMTPKFYDVIIYMEDNEKLFGYNTFTSFEDRGDKNKLIDNLRYNVQEYFRTKKVKPKSSSLNENETKKYVSAIKRINEIRELIK